MAVDASIGNQAEKMQPAPARLREGLLQNSASRQLSLLDRFVDAREILIHNSPGAEIEVADLGVAHLAEGQANIQPAGA